MVCSIPVALVLSLVLVTDAFMVPLYSKHAATPANQPYRRTQHERTSIISGTSTLAADEETEDSSTTQPQIFTTGQSVKGDLLEAIQEAVLMAMQQLPSELTEIDLCLISVSSLYDGGSYQPATVTVPGVLAATENIAVRNIIGSSCAGIVGGTDGVPVVSVTFMVLPETSIQCFHVDDVPPAGRMDKEAWLRTAGVPDTSDDPVFLLIPSPAYATDLDDLLQALTIYFPTSQTIGGIASTVSSLSRAKLFCYTQKSTNEVCFTEGCVGVALSGDIQVQSLTALGAKPVGGIYSVLKSQESTIQAIVLDKVATDALNEEELDEVEDNDEEAPPLDKKEAMAQLYAKAQIPKPVLAEANFIMRTLSDDDQAFMRRQLLVGLEQGGSVGRSASELERLAKGEGHRFTVYQVASAGMKDGSVHLPLGSVNIVPGTRLRFFVRDSNFAMREIEALWTGYKQRQLNDQFNEKQSFTPGMCLILPTMDRGNKFFQGKPNFETTTAATYLSGTNCISGFYSNGVIGKIDNSVEASATTGLQGSASGYFLIGSKTGRSVYSAAAAAEAAKKEAEERELADANNNQSSPVPISTTTYSAPRSEDGELVIKRREVHSGRAMTVSTVEWSVAEKIANPSSALEGFMWEKETEVDRFRERVPLANLVSQCRLSAADPTSPKPRDWIGALKQSGQKFVLIPECKRSDPASGTLWKRYDVEKLAREFTIAKAPAMSVNCDPVLFGGSMEHVTDAREGSSKAAVAGLTEDGVIVPPILASDLLLYPYQLYRMRLAGADAVNLIVGALDEKDLSYLIKIATSLQLQSLATVTSEVQLERLRALPKGSLDGIIVSNRQLADFSIDDSGEQALTLLRCGALNSLKELHGDSFVVLVEGKVGVIRRNQSTELYIQELKEAGATGAIVGGGLAAFGSGNAIAQMQNAISQ